MYLFPFSFGDFYELYYNLKLMKLTSNVSTLSFWIIFHIADFFLNDFDFW